MTRRTAALVTVLLAALSAACGRSEVAAPPLPQPRAVAPPAKPATEALPAIPVPVVPRYDPKGRRDPFEVLQARSGTGLSVTGARLVGIVSGARGTLALVETADGLGYVLRQGDTLGDGRVAEIGRDSVVFTVTPVLGSTVNRIVLRLQAD